MKPPYPPVLVEWFDARVDHSTSVAEALQRKPIRRFSLGFALQLKGDVYLCETVDEHLLDRQTGTDKEEDIMAYVTIIPRAMIKSIRKMR